MPVRMGQCARCAFFMVLGDTGGECRRNPPFPVGLIPGMDQWPPLTGMWPRVGKSDCCGEFVTFEDVLPGK